MNVCFCKNRKQTGCKTTVSYIAKTKEKLKIKKQVRLQEPVKNIKTQLKFTTARK